MDQVAFGVLGAGAILIVFWLMAVTDRLLSDRFFQRQVWQRKQELANTVVQHLWERKKQRMADLPGLRKGSK